MRQEQNNMAARSDFFQVHPNAVPFLFRIGEEAKDVAPIDPIKRFFNVFPGGVVSVKRVKHDPDTDQRLFVFIADLLRPKGECYGFASREALLSALSSAEVN